MSLKNPKSLPDTPSPAQLKVESCNSEQWKKNQNGPMMFWFEESKEYIDADREKLRKKTWTEDWPIASAYTDYGEPGLIPTTEWSLGLDAYIEECKLRHAYMNRSMSICVSIPWDDWLKFSKENNTDESNAWILIKEKIDTMKDIPPCWGVIRNGRITYKEWVNWNKLDE